eukprot:c17707_g1_i1.p1 GENE.c17707_g1_i1~~c17707_g1_i1.p1  ORF type:complete len:337 (+),score=132.65 c17707_g1_i1:47-1057(+)
MLRFVFCLTLLLFQICEQRSILSPDTSNYNEDNINEVVSEQDNINEEDQNEEYHAGPPNMGPNTQDWNSPLALYSPLTPKISHYGDSLRPHSHHHIRHHYHGSLPEDNSNSKSSGNSDSSIKPSGSGDSGQTKEEQEQKRLEDAKKDPALGISDIPMSTNPADFIVPAVKLAAAAHESALKQQEEENKAKLKLQQKRADDENERVHKNYFAVPEMDKSAKDSFWDENIKGQLPLLMMLLTGQIPLKYAIAAMIATTWPGISKIIAGVPKTPTAASTPQLMESDNILPTERKQGEMYKDKYSAAPPPPPIIPPLPGDYDHDGVSFRGHLLIPRRAIS